jgi:diguanylate cyclase
MNAATLCLTHNDPATLRPRRHAARLPRPEALAAGERARGNASLSGKVEDDVASRLRMAEARITELECALRQLTEISLADPLTGALNRRGIAEAFARETARAVRQDAPLTLAVLDLDDFKRVNDRYGHSAGDAALIRLTEIATRSLRPTDAWGRLGGEEFLVLMPDADLASAHRALNRLLTTLSRSPLPDNGICLSFSGGIAQHRAGETLEQLVGRADHIAYQAKRAGKARVLGMPDDADNAPAPARTKPAPLYRQAE